jgi:hypothetical protein
MRRILKTTAAIGLAAGATLATATVSAPAAQAAGTYQGCPSGAVCVYPDASWNGGRPSYVFYSYGGHNLSNQYGTHRVFNNQYGGAKAWFCWGYNGTDCRSWIPEWYYTDIDLTPINSIKLTAS